MTGIGIGIKAHWGGAKPFAPSDISGLALDLNGDLGITIATGVSAWADQSGNSRNFTQGTGANQPTYTASDSSYNNHGSLSFDGTNDSMVSPSFALSTFTLFMVARAATGNVLMGATGQIQYMNGSTGFSVHYQRGATYVAANASVNWSVSATPRTFVYSQGGTFATTALRVNGSAVTLTNVGSTSTGPSSGSAALYLMDNSVGSSRTQGTVARVLLYDSVLSAGDLANVEAYLNGLYAHY